MRAVPAAVAVAAIGLGPSACGSSGGSSSSDPAKPNYQGAVASPQRVAPPLRLDDSLGNAVDLKDYRGKAVLVTFIYDHCPDVCPLIVSNLHNALAQMGGQAAKAQVVAVSVDPMGDTPKTVRAFLAAHEMTGRMEYLIGSKQQLVPVWKQWGIQVQASPDSREVGHSAFVYGITGSGEVKALYPSDFKPAWVVHDVPILAAS